MPPVVRCDIFDEVVEHAWQQQVELPVALSEHVEKDAEANDLDALQAYFRTFRDTNARLRLMGNNLDDYTATREGDNGKVTARFFPNLLVRPRGLVCGD